MIGGLLWGAALLSSAAPLPGSLDLPYRPGVTEALERVATRTGVALPRASLPLQTAQVQEFLTQACERDAQCLTAADSLALQDLLTGPRELWRWKEGRSGSLLALNARGTYLVSQADTATAEGPEGDLRRLATLGGTVYGSLGNTLWFLSDAHIFTEWSQQYRFWDRYSIADGEPSGVPLGGDNRNGLFKERSGARYTAWAQWSNDWINIKYGRDRVRFGPGEWTGLTTRVQTSAYEQLDFRVDPFAWLTVESAILEARPSDAIESGVGPFFVGDTRKWVHVHRFEIHPVRGVNLAFQNQVLYKDTSGIKPSYVLPLVPIFFSQDLTGNRDNAAFQFDGTVNRIPFTSLWASWMIDDLNSLTDALGSHWLNRWAVLAGARVVSPWHRLDADLTGEFSLVRPWTYTAGREAAFSWAHFGQAMGSELGPDSRTLRMRLALRPWAKSEVRFTGFSLEKGIGRQAQIGIVHSPDYSVDAEHSSYFAGGKLLSQGLESQWQQTLWRDTHVTTSWIVAKNRKPQGSLVWNSWGLLLGADW